jgi:WD40 repeat protein
MLARSKQVIYGKQLGIVRPLSSATIAQPSLPWSPDGRYVVFARGNGTMATSEPNGLVVVDPRARAAQLVDEAAAPLFAPDGRHLVLVAAFRVAAIDLETGAYAIAERPSTQAAPRFAPDGRLAWGAREGDEDVVYLHDLKSGAETALRAPARRRAADGDEPAISMLAFGARDRLIAVSGLDRGVATLRVWNLSSRAIAAEVEGLASPAPALDDSGALVYAAPHDDGARLALSGASAAPLRSNDRACGDGLLDRYSPLVSCGGGRFVVVHDGSACMWDVARGSLVKTAAIDMYQEVTRCRGDAIELAYRGPPGTDDEPPHPPDDGKPHVALGGRDVVLATRVDEVADELYAAPDGAFVAGIVYRADEVASGMLGTGGRPRLWNARGQIAWDGLAAAEAMQIAFAPGGHELVAVGIGGRVWHVDLDRVVLRTTPPPDECKRRYGDVDEPFAVGGDGRAVLFCRIGDRGRAVIVEGARAPAVVADRIWSTAIATSSGASSIAIRDDRAVRILSATGVARWSLDPAPYAASSIGISAAGDRLAIDSSAGFQLYDASAHVRWTAPSSRSHEGPIAFSPDGRWIAGGAFIYDAASGTPTETLPTFTTAIAFASRGDRVAYWSRRSLGVRDLRSHVDVAKHELAANLDRPVRSIAWSSDDALLAAVTGEAITIWGPDASPRATLLVRDGGAALVTADGRVAFAGDAAAARAMLGCRIGRAVLPLADCR